MWIEPVKDRFRAVERYINPMTGKSVKVSVMIDKDTPAFRKRARTLLQTRIQEKLEDVDDSAMTLQKLVEKYLAGLKSDVQVSTLNRNKFACQTIIKTLGGDVLINKLTARYVLDRYAARECANATKNENLKRLKALLRWGYTHDYIEDVRWIDKLTPFKAPPHKAVIADKFLDANELRALLEAMTVPQWRLLTKFLALSGLRTGEALALEKSDVELEAGVIHVTKAYNSNQHVVSTAKSLCSIRDVYIQPELEAVIHEINQLMAETRLMYLLPKQKLFMFDKKGEHLQYPAYRKYLLETSAGIVSKHVTPHSMRHTHASIMMEQGVPIETISRRLGHVDSKITKDVYLHVTDKLREQDNKCIARTKVF